MTNDFDAWVEEYENGFKMASWIIVHLLIVMGIIFLGLASEILFQYINAEEFEPRLKMPTVTVCNGSAYVMEQWLTDAQEYKCHRA
jgi:hypothetical protein